MVNQKITFVVKFSILILLEAAVLLFLVSSFLNFNLMPVGGYINSTNVTLATSLEVGNLYPEFVNISINNGESIALIPNSTKLVFCEALIRDWNLDTNLDSVNATLFNPSLSSYNSADDNNRHYTNSSCSLDLNFGNWGGIADDEYLALANCTFNIWYYSDASSWNCTVAANNSFGVFETGSKNFSVLELLALGLPEFIDYGLVNATFVSDEQILNVTNYGNVMINLTLQGYANTPGDNLSMNCSAGGLKNISTAYQKYNLTASNPGNFLQNLTNFTMFYRNLTSNVSGFINKFNLNYRQEDLINDAINASYWRIYVPKGVAGTCSGNIVFGARKAAGS